MAEDMVVVEMGEEVGVAVGLVAELAAVAMGAVERAVWRVAVDMVEVTSPNREK